jgi:hypothetical protein
MKLTFTYEGELYSSWIEDGVYFYLIDENENMDILGVKKGDIDVNPSSLMKHSDYMAYSSEIFYFPIGSFGFEQIGEEVVKFSKSEYFLKLINGEVSYSPYLCATESSKAYEVSVIILSVLFHRNPQEIRLKNNEGLFE